MKRVLFTSRMTCVAVIAAVATFTIARPAMSQIVQRAVGGISIDPTGLLAAISMEDERHLEQLRRTALRPVPEKLTAFDAMRGVSLKQLEAQIAECIANEKPLPESVRYLAGLQRIEYVFVYPERNDIVLAGPAEGWKLDRLGNAVGLTTNRPVILLDDLVVALLTSESSRLTPISCSIEPTAEGMQRVQAAQRELRGVSNPQVVSRRFEEALGPQQILLNGVPTSSHFARVMVAADFRMKRLAMNFDEAPISKLPSFLKMAGGRNTSMTPRWWLAPQYDAIARDPDGLAWQLRGQGVQCKTEEDHFNEAGQRESSRPASPAAQRWAETFTKNYDQLAEHDSAFGMLRNVMDLAVIAALIEKEELLSVAGLQLPHLLNDVELAKYPVPREVPTQASFVKVRGRYTVSASGGVQMLPWHVADKSEELASVGEARQQFSAETKSWWVR